LSGRRSMSSGNEKPPTLSHADGLAAAGAAEAVAAAAFAATVASVAEDIARKARGLIDFVLR
jgi:hypothetical protein